MWSLSFTVISLLVLAHTRDTSATLQSHCRVVGAAPDGIRGCVGLRDSQELVCMDSQEGLVMLNRTNATLQRFAWQKEGGQIAGASYSVIQHITDSNMFLVASGPCIQQARFLQSTASDLYCTAASADDQFTDLAFLDEDWLLFPSYTGKVVWKLSMSSRQVSVFANLSNFSDPAGNLQLASLCTNHDSSKVYVAEPSRVTYGAIYEIDVQTGYVSRLFSSNQYTSPTFVRMWRPDALAIGYRRSGAVRIYNLTTRTIQASSYPFLDNLDWIWTLTTTPSAGGDIFYTKLATGLVGNFSLFRWTPNAACTDDAPVPMWLPPRRIAANAVCGSSLKEDLDLSYYLFADGAAALLSGTGQRLVTANIPPSPHATRLFVDLPYHGTFFSAADTVAAMSVAPELDWSQSKTPSGLRVFLKTPVVYPDTCRVQLELVASRSMQFSEVSIQLRLPASPSPLLLSVPCTQHGRRHAMCTASCRAQLFADTSDWREDRTAEVLVQNVPRFTVLFQKKRRASTAATAAAAVVVVEGPEGPVIPGVDSWINFNLYANTSLLRNSELASWALTFEVNTTVVQAQKRLLVSGDSPLFSVLLSGGGSSRSTTRVSGWRVATDPVAKQASLVLLCTIQLQLVPAHQLSWGTDYPSVLHGVQVLSLINDQDEEILMTATTQPARGAVYYVAGPGNQAVGFRTSDPPVDLGLYADYGPERDYFVFLPEPGKFLDFQQDLTLSFIQSVYGMAWRQASVSERQAAQCRVSALLPWQDCSEAKPQHTEAGDAFTVQVRHSSFTANVTVAVFSVKSLRIALKNIPMLFSVVQGQVWKAAHLLQGDCSRLQVLAIWQGHPSGNVSQETDVVRTRYHVHVDSSDPSTLVVVNQSWVCAVGQVGKNATLFITGTGVTLPVKIVGDTSTARASSRTLQFVGVDLQKDPFAPEFIAPPKVGLPGDVHYLVHSIDPVLRRIKLMEEGVGILPRQYTLRQQDAGSVCTNLSAAAAAAAGGGVMLYTGMQYGALSVYNDKGLVVARHPQDRIMQALGRQVEGIILNTSDTSGFKISITEQVSGENRAVPSDWLQWETSPLAGCSGQQPVFAGKLSFLQKWTVNISIACVEVQDVMLRAFLWSNQNMQVSQLKRIDTCADDSSRAPVYESLVLSAFARLSHKPEQIFRIPDAIVAATVNASSSSDHLRQSGDTLIFTRTGNGQGTISALVGGAPRGGGLQAIQASMHLPELPADEAVAAISYLEILTQPSKVIVLVGFDDNRGLLVTSEWEKIYPAQSIFSSVLNLSSTLPDTVRVKPDGSLQMVGKANRDGKGPVKLRVTQQCPVRAVASTPPHAEVVSPLQGNLEPAAVGDLDLGGSDPLQPPITSTGGGTAGSFDIKVKGQVQAFDLMLQYDPQYVEVTSCKLLRQPAAYFRCIFHSGQAEGSVTIIGICADEVNATAESAAGMTPLANIEFKVLQEGLTSFTVKCNSMLLAGGELRPQGSCTSSSMSVPFDAKTAASVVEAPSFLQQGSSSKRRPRDKWNTSWRKHLRFGLAGGKNRRLLQSSTAAAAAECYGDVDGDGSFTLLDLFKAYQYHSSSVDEQQLQRQQLSEWQLRQLYPVADPAVPTGMRDVIYLCSVYSGLLPFVQNVNFTSQLDLLSLKVQLVEDDGSTQVLLLTNSTQLSLASNATQPLQAVYDGVGHHLILSQPHEPVSADDILQRVTLQSEPRVGVAFVLRGYSGYTFPFFAAAPFRPYTALDIRATNVCTDLYGEVTLKAKQLLPGGTQNNRFLDDLFPITPVTVDAGEPQGPVVLLKFNHNSSGAGVPAVICSLHHAGQTNVKVADVEVISPSTIRVTAGDLQGAQYIAKVTSYALGNNTVPAYLGAEILDRKWQLNPGLSAASHVSVPFISIATAASLLLAFFGNNPSER